MDTLPLFGLLIRAHFCGMRWVALFNEFDAHNLFPSGANRQTAFEHL